jgi:hypothetical protein
LRLHRPVREVHRLAEHVHDPSQCRRSNRHRDRRAGVDGLHPALHAIGRFHRHGADAILAEMLLDLGDDVDRLRPVAGDADGVVDRRQMAALEFDVHDWTDHLHDFTDFGLCCYSHVLVTPL